MDASSLIGGFLSGERVATFQFTRWISLELRARGTPLADRHREDLIQETLLRLWTVLGRGDFRGESGLQRYVRAIAGHVLVDHLRKKSRKEVTGDTSFTTEPDSTAGADERLVARDLVERMLAGLDEEEGRLLVEAYVEERSYADMAEARGIAYSALKVRVFRAAQRARKSWERMRASAGGRQAGRVAGAGS